jgi:transposase InsO family protein/transposase-like protein
MHQRGQKTTFQIRLQISEQAASGLNDSQIAAALDCSIWTVRKWRRRSQKQGRSSLTSPMGRPATGPVSTFPHELQEAILQLRKLHPGWGPDTLLVALKMDDCWREQPLPSRARIGTLLKQAGLTRRYLPHNDLLQPARVSLNTPHQEWQMDAQGIMRVEGVGKVSLITIVDVVSRLKAESYPSLETTNPALPDYQLSLRRAFLTYGLPQVLTLDHGTVFYDNTTPSPFPTKLHLWLLALGVQVRFTRKRCPTDHAIIERTHQTMTAQALLGQTYPSPADLWAGLDARREVLNQHLPSRALSHQAPLEAYPHAIHSGRMYRPEWEEDLLCLQNVWSYLQQGRWFRSSRSNGVFALGSFEYYIGKQFAHRCIEIRFDPDPIAFLCQPEGSEELVRVPARGLTKAELMGELAALQALPAYQLALPFSREAWRQCEYANHLIGTTL